MNILELDDIKFDDYLTDEIKNELDTKAHTYGFNAFTFKDMT